MGRIIAITGGIGSGKSVVCRIVNACGYEVYDCDSRAKLLMDTNVEIIEAIAVNVCQEAVCNGKIDRRILSDAVFGCDEKLKKLNAIVHKAVIEDFCHWLAAKHTAFIETAILYTSGLDKYVSEVWEVTAPDGVRVDRVHLRNPELSEGRIMARIEAQKEESKFPRSIEHEIIVNDGITPVLPQVERLLQ